MQNLVIVESPTKAKTLAKFLGDGYRIEASMGHIRDLPKSEMGVDEKTFEPKYIVPRDKTKKANELKKIAKDAQSLWLATDPDREGEAISWHLAQLLGGKVKARRVVFHEITEDAVKEAFDNPRDINLKLVDAQQARRILDRLVGYKLSPLLWKKVKSGLSAGRVQSVALRLIVEREREIEKFKPSEYWSIEALLKPERQGEFTAVLVELNGKKLAVKDKGEADKHTKVLEKADYFVGKIAKKELRRFPYPPFTTSTLQQAASHALSLSAKKTMSLAQFLYEHGFITYMRTDSVNLSQAALSLTRSFIEKNLGKDYLPPQPRVYKTKSKLAQEAHEAIRPTDVKLTAQSIKSINGVTGDHVRLYDLIWKRMVACQMKEAVLDATTVDVAASGNGSSYTLRATGSVVKFDGWLKVWGKRAEEDGEEKVLPHLAEKESLDLLKLNPQQHFTEPPARYNDASLIKKLEELGIGRPSTYAPTLATIQERLYVERKERKFFPTPLGLAVTDFLVKNFPDVVDYAFTAQMEDELDGIAKGDRQWKPILQEFYGPFAQKVGATESVERVRIEAEVTDQKCPQCGKALLVRFGRFGKFLACSGFPECKYTGGFEEKVDAKCPDCGGEVVLRRTRKGRTFYGCKNYPGCKYASWSKPK